MLNNKPHVMYHFLIFGHPIQCLPICYKQNLKKNNNNGTVAKLYLALNNCFFIIIY